MIELKELKQYVNLHIKSQQFKIIKTEDVLKSIKKTPSLTNSCLKDSWESRWVQAANESMDKGHISDAIQCYNIARFPFPQNIIQEKAGLELTKLFKKEYCNKNIQKHILELGNKSFSFYTGYLDPSKPCLLVIGGIVSLKEQWKVFLSAGKKMGFSVIITEFPGVGENKLQFDENCSEMLGAILDSLSGKAKVDNTYIVGMSFGGQLAIKHAIKDERIKGITTVGAPLNKFYENLSKGSIPAITLDTLAHICRKSIEEIPFYGKKLALTKDEVRSIKIPITYVFSNKDEIIPQTEKQFIIENISNLKLIEFDDIHGSPNHLSEIQKLVPISVLKQSNSKNVFLITILSFFLFLEKRIMR